MKNVSNITIRVLAVLTLLCSATIMSSAQTAVIVNKSVSESSLDAGTVKNIYSLSQTKWSDGSKITVVANEDGSEEAFYSALGSSKSKMKKTWLKAKLTGEGTPPESESSAASVVAKVASTPGAIGFVPQSAVTDAVKVVATL